MEQIIPNTPPQTPPTISLDIPTNTPLVPKPSINNIYIYIDFNSCFDNRRGCSFYKK